MKLLVLDTGMLTLHYEGHPAVNQRVAACDATALAITIMTVDEQLTGWYTLTRQSRKPRELVHAYARLGDAVVRLAWWRILPFTEAAVARVAHLKSLRLKVGTMDLRIAAITLEHDDVLVTRNLSDFQRIPGLTVENWVA
jgi:tRNA(fMet)-specific endonuclease VapC